MNTPEIDRPLIPSNPTRFLRPALFVAGWIAAAVGSLYLAEMPADHTESMCGIWGCYPPLQALGAMHLFTAIVLGGMLVLIGSYKPCALRAVGWTFFTLGTAGLVLMVGIDLANWLASVPESVSRYWPKRIQYTILTHSDFPVVQAMVLGLVGVYFSKAKSCHGGACPLT